MFDDITYIEETIEYVFNNKELILRAFTHDSGVNIGADKSYQNLEFLGDSILNFVVAEELFNRHPSYNEGQLTKMRASLVSEKPLSEIIRKMGLYDFLIMGQSETNMGIKYNSKVMCDLFESIVGAIYLDSGMSNAKNFILKSLGDKIFKSGYYDNCYYDYKSTLNEYATKHGVIVKYVNNVNEEEMLRTQRFSYVVIVNDEILGEGVGATKKEAQQKAASVACKKLINE